MQPRLSPAVHRAPPAPSPAQPVERVWRGGGALSRPTQPTGAVRPQSPSSASSGLSGPATRERGGAPGRLPQGKAPAAGRSPPPGKASEVRHSVPRKQPIEMRDPRGAKQEQSRTAKVSSTVRPSTPRRQSLPSDAKVTVIPFYYPGKMAPCDEAAGFPELGNFWGCPVRLERTEFANAEGAFQALKFWKHADKFKDKNGDDVFHLKRKLESLETPDYTYHGSGSNFKGMMKVLEAKWKSTEMRSRLLQTGDALLLEHNSTQGRDNVWSNDQNGTGRNWLGFQLMLLRDKYTGQTQTGSWTDFLVNKCKYDVETGEPEDAAGAELWQAVVKEATDRVHERLGTKPQLSGPAAGSAAGSRQLEASGPYPTWQGPPQSKPAHSGQAQTRRVNHSMPHRSPLALQSGAAQQPSVATPRQQAAPVCMREGCTRPTWNGLPGEYCSRTCRDDAGQVAGGAASGTSALYACLPINRFAPSSQSKEPPLCKRNGCNKPTFNGKPGEYCSRSCQAAGQANRSQTLAPTFRSY